MWKILRNLPSLVEPLMEPLMEPGFDVQNWSRERSGGTQKRVKGARFGKKKRQNQLKKDWGFAEPFAHKRFALKITENQVKLALYIIEQGSLVDPH